MSLYRGLCTVVGPAATVLGMVLLLAPSLYLSLYVTEVTADMVFPAQRFAPVIIGLGVALFVMRDLERGLVAARFATVVAMVWAGVAGTGVVHFMTGVAEATIVFAAAVELILAAAFAVAAWRCR